MIFVKMCVGLGLYDGSFRCTTAKIRFAAAIYGGPTGWAGFGVWGRAACGKLI